MNRSVCCIRCRRAMRPEVLDHHAAIDDPYPASLAAHLHHNPYQRPDVWVACVHCGFDVRLADWAAHRPGAGRRCRETRARDALLAQGLCPIARPSTGSAGQRVLDGLEAAGLAVRGPLSARVRGARANHKRRSFNVGSAFWATEATGLLYLFAVTTATVPLRVFERYGRGEGAEQLMAVLDLGGMPALTAYVTALVEGPGGGS